MNWKQKLIKMYKEKLEALEKEIDILVEKCNKLSYLDEERRYYLNELMERRGRYYEIFNLVDLLDSIKEGN